MQQTLTFEKHSNRLTAQQIADLLAVVMWASGLAIDEFAARHRTKLGVDAVGWIEALLVSIRPVAVIRGELSRLESEQLLEGFAVWASRQRAVMNGLVASSLGRE